MKFSVGDPVVVTTLLNEEGDVLDDTSYTSFNGKQGTVTKIQGESFIYPYTISLSDGSLLLVRESEIENLFILCCQEALNDTTTV